VNRSYSETRSLVCELTEDERAALLGEAMRAASSVSRLDEELEGLKRLRSEAKQERSVQLRTVSESLRVAEAGWETRIVTVAISLDDVAGTACEVRQDTGEVIGMRPMLASERQGTLFDPGQGADAASTRPQ